MSNIKKLFLFTLGIFLISLVIFLAASNLQETCGACKVCAAIDPCLEKYNTVINISSLVGMVSLGISAIYGVIFTIDKFKRKKCVKLTYPCLQKLLSLHQ